MLPKDDFRAVAGRAGWPAAREAISPDSHRRIGQSLTVFSVFQEVIRPATLCSSPQRRDEVIRQLKPVLALGTDQ